MLASVVVTTAVVVQSRQTTDTIIGSQPSPVTSSAASALDLPRAATPLGNNVLLWPREVQANWDIWTITVDGVDSKRLTAGLGADTRPVLSADRRSFIYRHEPGAQTSGDASPSSADVEGLHVMAVDGSGDRLLFPTGPAASLELARPGWSPDGQLIASASRKQGEPAELVLVSITGDRVRTIASAPELDDPTFTPDGASVTYWASEPSDLNGGTLMMVPTERQQRPRGLPAGPARPGRRSGVVPGWLAADVPTSRQGRSQHLGREPGRERVDPADHSTRR